MPLMKVQVVIVLSMKKIHQVVVILLSMKKPRNEQPTEGQEGTRNLQADKKKGRYS